MDMLLSLYAVVCVLIFLQACLMYVHACEHRRFHRSRRTAPLVHPLSSRVSLFVPCKGIDPDLEDNLHALFKQNYPDFELCFVVESHTEPALSVIQRVRSQHLQQACRVVVAGLATDCSQKVHNLMRATQVISSDTEILAFVDSDACPHPQWLARLVGRLHNSKTAISTGYRWYIPSDHTWPNALLSGINNLVTGLMGSHPFNLVWGGAWAIRAETFRNLNLPDAWRGSLSDDLAVSRLAHQAGLKVAYEPHCLVTSQANVTWTGLSEFMRRQYLQVRVSAPLWWQAAIWTGLLNNLMNGLSIGLTVAWAISGERWWIPASCGIVSYALTGFRSYACMRAVRPFVNAAPDVIDRVERMAVWGSPVVALANWLGVLSAGLGRTIVWRGIRYRLNSAHETLIEGRDAPPLMSATMPDLREPASIPAPLSKAG